MPRSNQLDCVRRVASAAFAAVLIAMSGSVIGQSAYPNRPIRLIAPFPPGGSSDVLCRLLAQKLTEGFGQTVVVENRPGASGAIGFEAAAKAPNDGYTIVIGSSSTLATNPHLFKSAANVDIVHVPYKGGGQAVADLVTGQIQMVFADMVPAIPHIRSGRLRPLAVTGAVRSSAIPYIPTMIEAGVKDYRAELWWAILAPKGTAADVVGRLNAELGRIMKTPDVQAKYTELGVATIHSTPAQVGEFIKARSAEVGRILKSVGIEPE